MDTQNTERRDSKKSNKAGGGGGGKGQNRGSGGHNGSNNGGGGGSGNKSGSGGEKQRSHSQKSGKPNREIYKPPSMRSSKNRNSNSTSEQQSSKGNNDDISGVNPQQLKKSNTSNNINQSQKNLGNYGGGGSPPQNVNYNEGNDASTLPNNGFGLFGNGSGNGSNSASSVPSSPLISNRMQANFNNAAAAYGLATRMFNVNAKEFQFLPPGSLHQQQQQQQQQLSNFLSHFDPTVFYNNSPILAASGCYPLKQSKSSGNMNLLLQQQQQQQQQQAAALHQLQTAMGLHFPLQPGNFTPGNSNGGNQFNRLSQSKSSGNVPGGAVSKPRVRFDDEEPDLEDEEFGQLGNYLASLKLNGDVSGTSQASNFPTGYTFQQQQSQQQNKVPLSPQPVLKSSLQKSRTGFYLNLYGNQQQGPLAPPMVPTSPTKSVYGMNNTSPLPQHHASSTSNNFIPKLNGGVNTSHPSVVKRSRSFGPGNHHLPRASAATLLSASTSSSSSVAHSVYSDFCITNWPSVVQELVTAAVTGVDRIPARNWIEMVNGIFEAMLCDYRSPKKGKNVDSSNTHSTGINSTSNVAMSHVRSTNAGSLEMSTSSAPSVSGESTSKSDCSAVENNYLNDARDGICGNNGSLEDVDDEDDDDDDETDLTSAAVHIFLYFIQREKDRTVMESLLNKCFASFQRLSSCSVSSSAGMTSKSQQQQQTLMQAGKPNIARQWCNFLRFLSTLYSQVKLIRRQKQSQQLPGHSMDEMSFSLLALLCDSCLATLRSPQFYTAEMMNCLFTVLTSIGRDMEGTFPLKMKQLLAAVRDALLGIGPYHQHQAHYNDNGNANKSSLSPIVQKTLMQLIELHAANWQLPASAVRYYYSSVSKSSTSSTNTMNNSYSSTHQTIGNNNQMNQANSTNTSNNNTSSLSPSGSSRSTCQLGTNEKTDSRQGAKAATLAVAVAATNQNCATENRSISPNDVSTEIMLGSIANSPENE